MKKEYIQALFQNFEDAVCTIDDTECWSARDMQKSLGYSLWQNFTESSLRERGTANIRPFY